MLTVGELTTYLQENFKPNTPVGIEINMDEKLSNLSQASYDVSIIDAKGIGELGGERKFAMLFGTCYDTFGSGSAHINISGKGKRSRVAKRLEEEFEKLDKKLDQK